ncbi:hypothetical protein RHMOL_Rhmol06G0043000 [Rhododendron molle]|uniref:Uncharacterized protein n=1 Tax=Rhododendron molle TaxID=49168 RepID=A0ACC0NAB6_RHOML|nr:hypothetical protein RHMOL_Rhmol06G0043000 [Rhododendron molle]
MGDNRPQRLVSHAIEEEEHVKKQEAKLFGTGRFMSMMIMFPYHYPIMLRVLLIYPMPNFEKDCRLLEQVDKLAYKMFEHYITFEAVFKCKDAAPVYFQFQAIIFARPRDTKDGMEVLLCSLKLNA